MANDKPTKATKEAEVNTENDELKAIKEQLAQVEKEKLEAIAKAEKAEAEAKKLKEEAEANAGNDVAEAVVSKKVPMFKVQFIDEHTMFLNGETRTFPKGASAEVDQFIANKLMSRKLAVIVSK